MDSVSLPEPSDSEESRIGDDGGGDVGGAAGMSFSFSDGGSNGSDGMGDGSEAGVVKGIGVEGRVGWLSWCVARLF